MTTLASTLQDFRQRIQRAAKKPFNQQNTNATLIEPALCVYPDGTSGPSNWIDEIRRTYIMS